jgi:lactobin A/cerein 7B family class IIb bacteriocin
MKKLNLDAYGVQELNTSEMQNVDGGCQLIIIAAVALAVLAIDYFQDGQTDGSVSL